jgi:toxin ParE1/3/4
VARYELAEAVDADLTDIHAFTFMEFGERQADAYFESLEECLTRLADSPELIREIGFLSNHYRLFVRQRHSIYYTLARSGFLVVRMPGPGMNPDAHLPWIWRRSCSAVRGCRTPVPGRSADPVVSSPRWPPTRDGP